MTRHYTRVCNFYYGAKSKILVEKNKSLPLHGIKEISFNQIELIDNAETVGDLNENDSIKESPLVESVQYSKSLRNLDSHSCGSF